MGSVEGWCTPPAWSVTPERAQEALLGPDRRRGHQMVVALSGLGQPWALRVLQQALGHPDEMTRCLAAEGLGRWWRNFGQGVADEALIAGVARLLRDACEEVQSAAVTALLAVGQDEGARLLAERYPEVSQTLKAEILGALASNGYNGLAATLYRTRVGEAPGMYLTRVARRLRLDGAGGTATG